MRLWINPVIFCSSRDLLFKMNPWPRSLGLWWDKAPRIKYLYCVTFSVNDEDFKCTLSLFPVFLNPHPPLQLLTGDVLICSSDVNCCWVVKELAHRIYRLAVHLLSPFFCCCAKWNHVVNFKNLQFSNCVTFVLFSLSLCLSFLSLFSFLNLIPLSPDMDWNHSTGLQ